MRSTRFFLVGLLAFGSCTGPDPQGGPPPALFPGSVFYQPIPDNPEIDPDSAAYIADLQKARAGGVINMNLSDYAIPVARPQQGTPRTDVAVSWQGWNEVLPQVPIPKGVRPSSGTDGHLVVMDTERGISHEMWRAVQKGDTWQASGGIPFPLAGDGVNRKGSGIRGSSLSLLLGLITYDDVVSGRPFQHALAWAFDTPNSRYFAPPAASSDGKGQGRPGSIPEGARLQLDPALDVTTLGLSEVGVRLARAMQRYGLFCVDASGASTVYGEDLAGTGRTWQGLLSYDELHKIPVGRLRVLKMQKLPIP